MVTLYNVMLTGACRYQRQERLRCVGHKVYKTPQTCQALTSPTSMEEFHDSVVKHQVISMLPSHIYGMTSWLCGRTSTALYVTIPHLWNDFMTLWSNVNSSLCYHPTSALYVTIPHLWKDFTTLWSNIDQSLCYHPTSMEGFHDSVVKRQQLSLCYHPTSMEGLHDSMVERQLIYLLPLAVVISAICY